MASLHSDAAVEPTPEPEDPEYPGYSDEELAAFFQFPHLSAPAPAPIRERRPEPVGSVFSPVDFVPTHAFAPRPARVAVPA